MWTSNSVLNDFSEIANCSPLVVQNRQNVYPRVRIIYQTQIFVICFKSRKDEI